MANRPNILILMADQLQGRVLDPGHFCNTPHLDRLMSCGVRFARAYAPSATCVPSRTSLMTGLLPHNHGTQAALAPHWAQQLEAGGYNTGYFGKWGLSSRLPQDCGWQEVGEKSYKAIADSQQQNYSLQGILDTPAGYDAQLFYGVTDNPPENRSLGLTTQAAAQFLQKKLQTDEPWCCFVSLTEPHDPYICGEQAFAAYDVNKVPLSPSLHDNLAGRPGAYGKAQRVWQDWDERRHKEAATCYFASVTEVDAAFGQLLNQLEAAGKTEETIIVLTADHGDLLGAHGLYCKKHVASEEVYNIPMVIAGPGTIKGQTTTARVGLHDLGPTLLEMTASAPLNTGANSRSFASALRHAHYDLAHFQQGYAEFLGYSQRILWDGDWKFVFNGWDWDELYNLSTDPYEMHNLAQETEHQPRLVAMMRQVWRRMDKTGDKTYASQYPINRTAVCGPNI